MTVKIPNAEYHQRCYAGGSTRYTLDEITSAIREYEACEQKYMALVNQSIRLIKPHEEFGTMGLAYAPENIQKLNNQLDSRFIPGISLGGGKELWPVGMWQREISKYHTLIRKVRKALDACIAIAA